MFSWIEWMAPTGFLWVILFIIIMVIAMKQQFGAIKLYGLFISTAAMIAVLVSGSVFVYSILQKAIITDKEYIIGDRGYYGFDECNSKFIRTPEGQELQKDYTPEEKEKCETEREAAIIARRGVDFKETLLGAGTWFVVAGIVLYLHIPLVRRKEDEAPKAKKKVVKKRK